MTYLLKGFVPWKTKKNEDQLKKEVRNKIKSVDLNDYFTDLKGKFCLISYHIL